MLFFSIFPPRIKIGLPSLFVNLNGVSITKSMIQLQSGKLTVFETVTEKGMLP